MMVMRMILQNIFIPAGSFLTFFLQSQNMLQLKHLQHTWKMATAKFAFLKNEPPFFATLCENQTKATQQQHYSKLHKK